ncbi:acetyl/propionyl/methylcrotonyl-CoA carboxylase subunit alpha [Carboxylicivirga linearis]|uniref:Biotin/lipoyl-binding protein n=1 Tax=Carboxylicivirga linearis TaxID=1628157 RepID=A0ABS5JZY6_9BACT|nr:biotin carboxylase N-terminal domain-containing protein [Carboxylicivirga linearis]MBS2100470.1 biotin/lipoyl-binding protein [Carboxylicivirga linearis]
MGRGSKITKVLIPNRGEIAVRIIRAAHDLGIKTVVTLTELEQDTIPAEISDEVHFFDGTSLAETYLNIPLIIDLAKKYNADSIHPGYGFLAENENLAIACSNAEITFIGPSAENLQQMGDKQTARTIARKSNVPITQSWEGSVESILKQVDQMQFPVLIKAAMGGGGKGMAICHNAETLKNQLPSVARQAKSFFGDDRVYVESYIESPRHIEVQVLADDFGNTVHLFERECSIQRRFQKIIEEAPAPNLSDEKRNEITSDAIRLCKSIGYKSAGTLEFLLDNKGKHYFLEMNTRIQVEHCVTEEITNIDLVKWQFKIAAGESLSLSQDLVSINGHAIQARIYAEDPEKDFAPSPGIITNLILPQNDELRMEMAFDQPTTIHPQFDPMIAKFIVHQANRNMAIEKLSEKLGETAIDGIKTNLSFLQNTLNHKTFIAGKVHTHFCQTENDLLLAKDQTTIELSKVAYSLIRFYSSNDIDGYWRLFPHINFSYNNQNYLARYRKQNNEIHLTINHQEYIISEVKLTKQSISFFHNEQALKAFYFENNEIYKIIINNQEHIITASDILPEYQPNEEKNNQINGSTLYAPLPGQVAKILVKEGQRVKEGDVLVILEAMKMENRLSAWKDTLIEQIHVQSGDQVKSNQLLITTN